MSILDHPLFAAIKAADAVGVREAGVGTGHQATMKELRDRLRRATGQSVPVTWSRERLSRELGL